MSCEKLHTEVLALPSEDRAELAYALLESLHEDVDSGVESGWIAELDRRAQAVADGTAKLVDWEQACERTTARLRVRRETRSSR